MTRPQALTSNCVVSDRFCVVHALNTLLSSNEIAPSTIWLVVAGSVFTTDQGCRNPLSDTDGLVAIPICKSHAASVGSSTFPFTTIEAPEEQPTLAPPIGCGIPGCAPGPANSIASGNACST